MSNLPESTDNDWFGEQEDRDFKSKMKHKRQHLMLNPDDDMVRNSKYMSGCMLWALVVAVAILLVCGALALGVSWLT